MKNKTILLLLVITILIIPSTPKTKAQESMTITSETVKVIIGDTKDHELKLRNEASEDYNRVDIVRWNLIRNEEQIGSKIMKNNATINGITLYMEDNSYTEMYEATENSQTLTISANSEAEAGTYTIKFAAYAYVEGSIEYYYPTLELEVSNDPFELHESGSNVRIANRGGKEAYPGDNLSTDLKITNYYSNSADINVRIGITGEEQKTYETQKTIPSGTNTISVETTVPEFKEGNYIVSSHISSPIVNDEETWDGEEISIENGLSLETFSLSNSRAEIWEENQATFSLINYRNQAANVKLRITSENGVFRKKKEVELPKGSSTKKISVPELDPGEYQLKGELIKSENIIGSSSKELTILNPIELQEPEINFNNQGNATQINNIDLGYSNPRDEVIPATIGIKIINNETGENIYDPSDRNVRLDPEDNTFSFQMKEKLSEGKYKITSSLSYKNHLSTENMTFSVSNGADNNGEVGNVGNNETNNGFPVANGFPWEFAVIPLIAILVAVYILLRREKDTGPDRRSPLGRKRSSSDEIKDSDLEESSDGIPK